MRTLGQPWVVGLLLAAAALTAALPSSAQPLTDEAIELDGQTLRYSMRLFPPGAGLMETAGIEGTAGAAGTAGSAGTAGAVGAAEKLAPDSALNTAKLLNQLLTAGRIEDAAVLSNAPRRRYEVLRDYRQSVGEDAFKQVFTQYFQAEFRLLAEILIDRHSLLVWHSGKENRYAGQYYVRIEDKVLMDDAPSETRLALRRILDAIRAGKIRLPG